MADRDALARYVAGEDVAVDVAAADEAAGARRFAAGQGDVPDRLSLAVARALVAVLVERRDAERLTRLAASGGRDVAKEARRGLHLLRTKGIAAEAPRPAAGPAPTPVAESPEAWTAPPDGAGERIVAIVRPAAGGGYDLAYVNVSDETGLADVMTGHGPRRVWRDLKRRFEEEGLVFAPIPLAYGQALVDEAYERTLALGRSPPPEFAAARGVVGRAPAGVRELEAPLLAEIAAAPLGREDAAALHELPDLGSWLPPRELLDQLALRIEEVDTSTLLVDDRQRAEARAAAVDRAIAACFDDAGRARWRRRLLDAAIVYARAGRPDDAARLRAQAERLAAPDFAPAEDAFARTLVEKILHPDLRGTLVASALAPSDQGPPAGERKIITP